MKKQRSDSIEWVIYAESLRMIQTRDFDHSVQAILQQIKTDQTDIRVQIPPSRVMILKSMYIEKYESVKPLRHKMLHRFEALQLANNLIYGLFTPRTITI